MSKQISIKKHSRSLPVMLGNHRIQQAIPLHGLEQISPFILLHHFDFEMQPGDASFYVPPHPHRGFCPITYMFEGSVEHNDSFGNHKVINKNEVQWINAGRGIIHSEKASKEMIETGGRYQGIQLWVNLFAKDKMKPASYEPITSSEMTLIEKKGIELRLVSGEMEGHKGPAISDTITAMLRMQPNSFISFSLPVKNNSAIYLLQGNAEINGDKFMHNDLIWFNEEEGEISVAASSEVKLLIMSGQPINEPLVSHGPFVMNTQTEILEAMRDYEQGKMGFLAY